HGAVRIRSTGEARKGQEGGREWTFRQPALCRVYALAMACPRSMATLPANSVAAGVPRRAWFAHSLYTMNSRSLPTQGRLRTAMDEEDWSAVVPMFIKQVAAGEAGVQKIIEGATRYWSQIPLDSLRNFFKLDDPGRDVRPLLPA